MENKNKKIINNKGMANRLAFLKYYLTENIDGRRNACFGKVEKAGKKAGYSSSYAKGLLRELAHQQNEQAETYRNLQKSLQEALKMNRIDGNWLADRLERLGNKNDKRIIGGKLFDTGDPDSGALRVALEFIGKTQKLYEDNKNTTDEFDGYSKEQLEEYVLGRIEENR